MIDEAYGTWAGARGAAACRAARSIVRGRGNGTVVDARAETKVTRERESVGLWCFVQ